MLSEAHVVERLKGEASVGQQLWLDTHHDTDCEGPTAAKGQFVLFASSLGASASNAPVCSVIQASDIEIKGETVRMQADEKRAVKALRAMVPN
jgi:hypothetical protein